VYKLAGNPVFNTQAVINYLGLENRIKRHGFKFNDKLLVENGE